METKQFSIENILREIDALARRVADAKLDARDEYQRTKINGVLAGVREILTSYCLSPSGEEGFYYYELEVGDRER
jgi:hypothetical protein